MFTFVRAVLVGLVMFAAFGCGGPTHAAQAGLAATAHALVAVDRELAPRYTSAADEAREHTATWSEYDGVMQPWNDAELALRSAHLALLVAQAGLDAWRAGDDRGWLASAPCLVEALDRLHRLLEAVGVWLEPLTRALALSSAFAGRCTP